MKLLEILAENDGLTTPFRVKVTEDPSGDWPVGKEITVEKVRLSDDGKFLFDWSHDFDLDGYAGNKRKGWKNVASRFELVSDEGLPKEIAELINEDSFGCYDDAVKKLVSRILAVVKKAS